MNYNTVREGVSATTSATARATSPTTTGAAAVAIAAVAADDPHPNCTRVRGIPYGRGRSTEGLALFTKDAKRSRQGGRRQEAPHGNKRERRVHKYLRSYTTVQSKFRLEPIQQMRLVTPTSLS